VYKVLSSSSEQSLTDDAFDPHLVLPSKEDRKDPKTGTSEYQGQTLLSEWTLPSKPNLNADNNNNDDNDNDNDNDEDIDIDIQPTAPLAKCVSSPIFHLLYIHPFPWLASSDYEKDSLSMSIHHSFFSSHHPIVQF